MVSLKTISPSTNRPILTREEVSQADAIDIPKRAWKAFESFSQCPLAERQAIVSRALDRLYEDRNNLAKQITEQMGRPISYTEVEVVTAIQRGKYMLKISDEVLKDTPGDAQAGIAKYIKKVPIGPVLVIFAWNYPYLILINSLIPALLAGNSVILKPSPQTPTVVEQIKSTFEEAGLPQDVIQYYHCGSPKIINTMVQDENIKLICFTGSVAVGLALQKVASERIVNVGLELGGKDAAYVRPDVDIEAAAKDILDGAVFNSGQSCCSVERVYVHDSIHDDFVAAIQKALMDYKLGDPMKADVHLGPVISRRSKDVIESHIEDAIAKGAHDATPDNATFKEFHGDGNYVHPRLLTNVDHTMLVMTEETFGPVIPIMKVRGDDEAVQLANDSQFGLSASVWTKDIGRGTELIDQINAGTVFINRCDFPAPDLAWTGFQTKSGKGSSLSKFGFDQFVKLKSYHIKTST